MPFLDSHKAKIYYEVHGEGPGFLLIAGLSSDSNSWQYIKKPLSKEFTLIIYDNRGCGRTESEGPFNLADLASDAISLIDHLGHNKVHLLGHSMGGMIAQEIAITQSERIDKLILASSSTRLSDKGQQKLDDLYNKWLNGIDMAEWYRLMFKDLFSSKVTSNKQFMDAAIIFALSYPYAQSLDGFKRQLDTIKNFDFSHRIRNILHETLIISGSEDILIPVEESRQLLNIGGKTHFQIIDEAAHSLHAEKPGEFSEIVMKFCG